jgi:hypothetical protein
VHFILHAKAVRLFKAPAQDANNPFALFSERASKADEEAYADL